MVCSDERRCSSDKVVAAIKLVAIYSGKGQVDAAVAMIKVVDKGKVVAVGKVVDAEGG